MFTNQSRKTAAAKNVGPPHVPSPFSTPLNASPSKPLTFPLSTPTLSMLRHTPRPASPATPGFTLPSKPTPVVVPTHSFFTHGFAKPGTPSSSLAHPVDPLTHPRPPTSAASAAPIPHFARSAFLLEKPSSKFSNVRLKPPVKREALLQQEVIKEQTDRGALKKDDHADRSLDHARLVLKQQTSKSKSIQVVNFHFSDRESPDSGCRDRKMENSQLYEPTMNFEDVLLDLNFAFEAYPPMKQLAERFQMQHIPSRFQTLQSYVEAFTPLLVLEFCQQIVQAQEASEGILVEGIVAEIIFTSYHTEIKYLVREKDVQEIWNEMDLLLYREGGKVHAIKVVKKTYKACAMYEFQLQCSLKFPRLHIRQKVHLCKVVNMVTVLREHNALLHIDQLPLSPIILDPTKGVLPMSSMYSQRDFDKLKVAHQLNNSQAKAVLTSLDQEFGFVLIQGPPGTGKTSTIISILGVLLMSHPRVLVCAPSNAAVDVITRKVLHGLRDIDGQTYHPRIVRIGNPDMFHPEVAKVAFDHLVEEEFSNTILQKVAPGGGQSDFSALLTQKKAISGRLDQLTKKLATVQNFGDIQEVENEIAAQKDHYFRVSQLIQTCKTQIASEQQHSEAIRQQVQSQILQSAQIITCTLSAAGQEQFQTLIPRNAFDIVVIDEAAQCVELSALIPLCFGAKKCICVGDPNQLPPTVFSKDAKDFQYSQSLFERIQKCQPDLVMLLDTQYRMHPQISYFPGQFFYQRKLVDGIVPEQRTMPWHDQDLFRPFLFIDVPFSHQIQVSKSFKNPIEANAIMYFVDLLASSFPQINFASKIGILSPYKEQVQHLRGKFQSRFHPSILDFVHINTINNFQGQETEIILFTTVKMEHAGPNSFLADLRWMNVGLTRAKTTLWIFGHAKALERNACWNELITYAKSQDLFRTLKNVPSLSRTVPRNLVPPSLWPSAPKKAIRSNPPPGTPQKRRKEAKGEIEILNKKKKKTNLPPKKRKKNHFN